MSKKTKVVTIHNWDGSKYDVEAPINAKYVGILSHTGCINFYASRPKLQERGGYYPEHKRLLSGGIYGVCPPANYPEHDGYGHKGPASELLLKIEEV